jgi:hypothetical protein
MFRPMGILMFLGLVLISSPLVGQEKSKVCQVTVNSPKPGDQVGKSGRARGTATIPPNSHLWVLAHVKYLGGKWWPQGDESAWIDPETKEWVVPVGYGTNDDIGEDFEVATAVVDAGTDQRLRNWFADSKAKNSYDPIPFPNTIDGCPPIKVVVHKISH